jgi:hypothetical protein
MKRQGFGLKNDFSARCPFTISFSIASVNMYPWIWRGMCGGSSRQE